MTEDIGYTLFKINYKDEDGVREFEEFIGDCELQIRVYKNTDDLNRVRDKGTPVDAYMNIESGHMTMHFSEDLIAMALIVHESIHAMFWNYDRLIFTRPKKKRYRKKINVFNHPEEMVHFGGNLSTIVYAQLTSKFEVTM